jgi:hypothetical protein
MKANLRILWLAVLFALCFGGRVGHAGPVGPLTTFTAGTPALASEVNGNFSAVKTAVDDNASRITTLQTTVTPAGNIVLVPSTATAGNILKGTTPFIHNFGLANTFIGVNAGNFTMTGDSNTAFGASALTSNTSGINNAAAGFVALFSNTTGSNNTASGNGALLSNTIGNSNTATGFAALAGSTTGDGNTASGANALQLNTIGNSNTASGASALGKNTTGGSNTASGRQALQSNTTGGSNTASGRSALLSNTTGSSNTASGASALDSNTTGNSNTASGSDVLFGNTTGSNNTASGAGALIINTTGSNNIAIGANAGNLLTTGSNNIDIGNVGVAGESSTIRIGTALTQTAAFIAGIRNITTANVNAVAVMVDSAGQLGTVSSTRRVKDDITDMGDASSKLMKLRPVTFHYKTDKNPKGRTLQYGLVAEEVAEVAPGLVARSADGKIETVYYQFLAPMLLNEYQKQQRTIEVQTAELKKQRLEIAGLRQQTARIADLEKRTAQMTLLLGRLEQAGMIAAAGR